MRCSPLLALSLFSAILPGQTAPSKPAIVFRVPETTNCPVDLAARHAQSGGFVQVMPSAPHPGNGYTISFSHDAHSIAQARVTLRGVRGPHAMPAANGGPGNGAETFTLVPSADGKNLFKSVVYADQLTAVLWVELNEVTYADGTEWHENKDAPCQVAPNGFMLVAGK